MNSTLCDSCKRLMAVLDQSVACRERAWHDIESAPEDLPEAHQADLLTAYRILLREEAAFEAAYGSHLERSHA